MLRLDQIPPGFYLDEASGSYDAYALWHTGYDQHGVFLPLALRAFNDYRSPLFSYLMAPWIGFAGLSVMTARLTSVYWGLLSIAALYWVGSMLFNRSVGVVAAFLLTIAPWHVHFSRLAIEVNLAALCVLLALGLFYRWQRTSEARWLWGAAFISGIGLYSYSIAKMTLPIIVCSMALIFWRKLTAHFRMLIGAICLGAFFAIPVLTMTLRSPDIMQDHFRQISILEPTRPVVATAVEVVRNFWANLSPRYLFYEGSLDIIMHPPGMGQLYAVQAVLLVLGIIWIISHRDWHLPGGIMALWIIASIFPATLTRHPLGTGHAQRTYPVVIPWQLLSAVGFVGLYQWFKPRIFQIAAVFGISIGIFVQGWRYYSYYFTGYAMDSALAFNAGVDVLVNAVDAVDDAYHAVYYTTYENDHPYIHFLFFSRYDPVQLQETALETDPLYPDRVIRMGKYTFTEKVKELYLSGLPGLYIMPAFDLPGVAGLGVIPGPDGNPRYKIVGRDNMMLDTADWLGQCTFPVPPLTYEMVAPAGGTLWLANYDCNTTWIYPRAGMVSRGYVFHQELATQMNVFTRRHMVSAQEVLSLPAQIRDVGAFIAYEQNDVPQRPVPVDGFILPAEVLPDGRTEAMLSPVTFDETLTFLGTRVYSGTEQIEIETWWAVDKGTISRPVSIMAHLLDGSGNLLSNADGLGMSAVVLRKGDYVVQRHVFEMLHSESQMWLRLGVYWLDTMERWTITGHAGADAFFVMLVDNG